MRGDIVFAIGLIIGMLAIFVIAKGGTDIEKIEVFQREDKPTVIRVYRSSAMDLIFIQDPEVKDRYISQEEYLEGIPDEVERRIMEIKIKEIAGWYNKHSAK